MLPAYVAWALLLPTAPSHPIGVLVEGEGPTVTATLEALPREIEGLVPGATLDTHRLSDERASKAALDGATHEAWIAIGPDAAAWLVKSAPASIPFVSGLSLPSIGETPSRIIAAAPLDDIEHDVARLKEMMPLTRLAVAADPGLELDALVTAAEKATGIRISVIRVAPDGTLDRSLDGYDALLFSHALRVGHAGRERLFEAALDAGVAVADSLGHEPSSAALTTFSVQNAATLRARRIALSVSAALGERPPPAFDPMPDELVVNMEVANRLKIGVPYDVLIEARLVARDGGTQREKLSIDAAATDAVAQNPSLDAARHRLESSAASVRVTRGALLPQVSVMGTGQWIDADRALSPFPPAERQLQWTGEARQSLFSAEAWRAFSTQEQQQNAREAQLTASRLDVHGEAGRLYIEVLRRLAAEKVQRENLERTRLNLSLARVRLRAGAAGRDEVFRFEIEVAQNKQSLIQAFASRKQAEIQLNIYLAAEPERAIETPDLEEGTVLSTDSRLAKYMDDPLAFARFRAFAEQVAVERSPEVSAARANVGAAERSSNGYVQALFIPDIDVFGTFTHRFAADGEGTNVDTSNVGFNIYDDLDWTIGVQASLPLFSGFARYQQVEQANAETEALRTALFETELAAKARVRTALFNAGASRAGARLSKEAAESAEKALELVRDAYRRGRVDIIRLVDAQTQSLTTRLDAADATYGFRADFIEVERAMARFSFGPERSSNDALFTDLAAFVGREEGTP